MIQLDGGRRFLQAVILPVALATLGTASEALSQGAYGGFRDRAHRDEALRRLSPEEERQIKVWALQNPEAARRLQGGARDPQSAILEQYRELSPEELDALGGDVEIEVE
ncbi:MAG: hypothetical protein ACREQY_17415 [Candidatus Binatia bacterium]